MSDAVSLAVATQSHRGHRRAKNEDYLDHDLPLGLAVIADGMGGHGNGEVASRLAVEESMRRGRRELAETEPARVGDALRTMMEAVNTAVFELARARSEYQGMGTTLSLVYFRDEHVHIGHVGDSRVYRLRHGRLEQLTRDHTVTQELIDRGVEIDFDRDSPIAHMINQAIGPEPHVAVDCYEHLWLPKDLYLLCTDGLHGMISEEAIGEVLQECGDDLEQSGLALVDKALQAGGRDNVSLILVRVEPDSLDLDL